MKLRFFENTVKPVACTIIPHSTDYSRMMSLSFNEKPISIPPKLLALFSHQYKVIFHIYCHLKQIQSADGDQDLFTKTILD